MTAPTCNPGMAIHRTIPDVDGDGLSERLVSFDSSRIIETIGPECFYRLLGQDSFCPADEYSHDDGRHFLLLSSGKTLSQLRSLQDEYGRRLQLGDAVTMHYVGTPPLAGKIERFSDHFLTLDDGVLRLCYGADVRLGDGTLRSNVPFEVLLQEDAISRIQRGATALYGELLYQLGQLAGSL